jgi:Tfp pilus assembly protein FimT
MPRGATLPELVTVTLIIGVVASVLTPPLRRTLDSIAVAGAAQRFASVHETARQTAIARATLVRYELARDSAAVALATRTSGGAWDTLRVWTLGPVQVAASQRAVTFSPLGVGYGASNSRVVFARGAAVETLTVSRTGRLRRW